MFRLSATNVCMLCECVVTICEKFVVVFLFLGLFFGNEHHKPTREEKNEKKRGRGVPSREREKRSRFFFLQRERDAKNLCSSHSTFSESY